MHLIIKQVLVTSTIASSLLLFYSDYEKHFDIAFSFQTFSKTVTAILASVKAREDGKMGKPGQPPTSMSRPGAIGPMGGQGRPGVGGGMMPGTTNSAMLSQPRQLPNYNRLI